MCFICIHVASNIAACMHASCNSILEQTYIYMHVYNPAWMVSDSCYSYTCLLTPYNSSFKKSSVHAC